MQYIIYILLMDIVYIYFSWAYFIKDDRQEFKVEFFISLFMFMSDMLQLRMKVV